MKALVKAANSQSFTAGDVIVVKDDSHVWGSAEVLPDFYQLDIADTVAADFSTTLEVERIDTGTTHPLTGGIVFSIGKRRLKGLNIALLPAGAQVDLTNTGIATVTKVEFEAAIVNR